MVIDSQSPFLQADYDSRRNLMPLDELMKDMQELERHQQEVIANLKRIRRMNRITTTLSWLTIALLLAAVIIGLCPLAWTGGH
jgi:hypothetical protein